MCSGMYSKTIALIRLMTKTVLGQNVTLILGALNIQCVDHLSFPFTGTFSSILAKS